MKREAPVPLRDEAPRDWHVFYRQVIERCENHSLSAIKRQKRYKRQAGFLHVAIPLVSLAVSITATSSFPRQGQVVATLAIVGSILTGVNYILEPSRRYNEYANACIDLYDLKYETDVGVERMADVVPVGELLSYLVEQNLRVSEIGRRMAGLPIAREHLS